MFLTEGFSRISGSWRITDFGKHFKSHPVKPDQPVFSAKPKEPILVLGEAEYRILRKALFRLP